MTYDVGIIGAGPAGLMAAIFSAKTGAKTVIVESNPIPCKKLLLTGGGRCNITHEGSIDHFVKAYGPYGRFLRHSLYEFSAEDLRQFFAKSWLTTKVEKNGCIFPITDRAADVSRVLLDMARRQQVRFLINNQVEQIELHEDCFVLNAKEEVITCKSLIIATGGKSWRHTGSTGDGYEFAQGFGHTIVEPKAALTGLVTPSKWMKELSGVSLDKVKITALMPGGKAVSEGPFLFTDKGISGPAVLDISREITDYLHGHNEPVQLYVDLMMDLSPIELEQLIIKRCNEHPKKELAGMLTGLLPRSLALNLCHQLEPDHIIMAGHLPKSKRRDLVKLIKYLPLTVEATRPIEEATITRGGISIREIDSKTMQSKLCRNLYFAGEVMDVDGPCGGYNLQICWSTGTLAGKSAAIAALGGHPIQEVTPKTTHPESIPEQTE